MRRHVQRMPDLTKRALEADDKIDLQVGGHLKILSVKQAFTQYPCLLSMRLYRPAAKCFGRAIKPKFSGKIWLEQSIWKRLRDFVRQVECPKIDFGKDCCREHPEITMPRNDD